MGFLPKKSRDLHVHSWGQRERFDKGITRNFEISNEFRMADRLLWSAALHTSMVMDAIRKRGRMRTADMVAWLRGLPGRCKVMNPTVAVCFQKLFLLICQPLLPSPFSPCATASAHSVVPYAKNGYGDECQPKVTVIAIHFWKHRFRRSNIICANSTQW